MAFVGESSGSVGVMDRVKDKLPGGKGKAEAPPPEYATLGHVPGFSYRGEGIRPESTLTPMGREVAIERPRFTAELTGRYTRHLHGDLDRLIGMKKELMKDMGEEAGSAEFTRLINTDRYRQYGMLYEQLTEEKAGTSGWDVSIKEEAVQKYMSTKEGMDTIYGLKIREQAEQALDAVVYLHMNQPEGQPGMIRSEEASATRERGGMLREGARWINLKMREPANRINGREGSNPLHFDTKGEKAALGALATVDLSVIGAGLGALGGPLGIPLGAVAGALITPAMAGILHSARSGDVIEITQVIAALQAATSDRDAVSWANHFYNQDPFDYEVVGNEVRLKEGIIAGTRKDAKTVRDNLIGNAKDLMDYQAQMGIKPEHRTPMDTRWIIEGTGQPPQQGTEFERRVLTRMRGQILDTHVPANPSQIENPPGSGNWVQNLAYDANNVDIVGNIQRYDAAFLAVLQSDIEGVFRGVLHEKDFRDELATEVNGKMGKFGPGGTAAKERKTKIDAELAEGGPLKRDAATLDAISAELDAFKASLGIVEGAEYKRNELLATITLPDPKIDVRTAINAHIRNNSDDELRINGVGIESIKKQQAELDQEIEQDLDDNWRRRSGNAVPTEPTASKPLPFDQKKPDRPDEPTALAGDATDAEKAVYKDRKTAYELKLRAYTSELELYDRLRIAHDKKETDYEKSQDAYQAKLIAYAAREEAEREKLRTTKFKKRQEDINADETTLRTFLSELTTADKAVEDARRGLTTTDAKDTVRQDLDTEFREMREEGDRIVGWNGEGGVNLTRDALQEETIDELNSRINQAHQANSSVGWPKEANGLEANRQILLKAMVEARLTEDTFDNLKGALDPNLWGLGMYDLLVMDTPGIKTLIQQRIDRLPAGTLALPDDAEIDAVRTLARTHFEETQVALRELKRTNGDRQRELANEGTSVEENGVPVPPALEVLNKFLATDRYGSIREEITRPDLDLDRLLSLNIINRTQPEDSRNYAAYENGRSRASVEIRQLLLDHRHDETAEVGVLKGPEAALQRNMEVISDDELGRLLAERFHMPILPIPPGAPIFQQAVGELRDRLGLTAGIPRTMARKDLADFFTERIIYGVLRPQIQTL